MFTGLRNKQTKDFLLLFFLSQKVIINNTVHLLQHQYCWIGHRFMNHKSAHLNLWFYRDTSSKVDECCLLAIDGQCILCKIYNYFDNACSFCRHMRGKKTLESVSNLNLQNILNNKVQALLFKVTQYILILYPQK